MAASMLRHMFSCGSAESAFEKNLVLLGKSESIIHNKEIEMSNNIPNWEEFCQGRTTERSSRLAHRSNSSNQCILVVGGKEGKRVNVSTEVFYVATNKWQKGPDLSTPRSGCAVVALGVITLCTKLCFLLLLLLLSLFFLLFFSNIVMLCGGNCLKWGRNRMLWQLFKSEVKLRVFKNGVCLECLIEYLLLLLIVLGGGGILYNKGERVYYWRLRWNIIFEFHRTNAHLTHELLADSNERIFKNQLI